MVYVIVTAPTIVTNIVFVYYFSLFISGNRQTLTLLCEAAPSMGEDVCAPTFDRSCGRQIFAKFDPPSFHPCRVRVSSPATSVSLGQPVLLQRCIRLFYAASCFLVQVRPTLFVYECCTCDSSTPRAEVSFK